MQWDQNEGRWTTVLPGGIVAHASRRRDDGWWELLVPALEIYELIRNRRLETWLTARPVVERVLRAQLDGPAAAPSTGDMVRDD